MSAAPSAARPRIVVLDDWERAFHRLGDWGAIEARADVRIHHAPLRGDALLAALRDAHALVLNRDRTPLDAAQLAAAPDLRYVIFTGPRNFKLDRAALAARGIPVSNTEGGPARETTAEHTWSLILAAARGLMDQVAALQAGQWRTETPMALPTVLHGRRLGVLGLGNIGSQVARVGRAFGMDVVAWSPHLTAERAAAQQVSAVSLETLLASSHVVSLHLVVAPATHHLINAERLALMRPDAILVNTSRAALVDSAALLAALRRGRPGFAALDVYDTEPPPADDPLLALPNVLAAPHTGFISQPAFARFVADILACLDAWLDGRPIVREVPPPDARAAQAAPASPPADTTVQPSAWPGG